MLSGSITGIVWYYMFQASTNIHTFFAALIVSTVAMIVVSNLTKKPPKEIEDLMDYAAAFDDYESQSNYATIEIGLNKLVTIEGTI